MPLWLLVFEWLCSAVGRCNPPCRWKFFLAAKETLRVLSALIVGLLHFIHWSWIHSSLNSSALFCSISYFVSALPRIDSSSDLSQQHSAHSPPFWRYLCTAKFSHLTAEFWSRCFKRHWLLLQDLLLRLLSEVSAMKHSSQAHPVLKSQELRRYNIR